METFFNSFTFTALIRLLISAVLGGVLGFERMKKMRPAGLRTYALVAISSCMTILLGELMSFRSGTVDNTRIAAAVISGIGFLGAGTIITSGYNKIRGLTTAAGLWVSACTGLAVGSGFYSGAVILTVISLLVITLGERFQLRSLSASRKARLCIFFKCMENAMDFIHKLEGEGTSFSNVEFRHTSGIYVGMNIDLEFEKKRPHKEIIAYVKSQNGVAFAEEV